MSDEHEEYEGWLSKPEVAQKLGRSLAAVTRLTKDGRLTPVSVKRDGHAGPAVNMYDPAEVDLVLATQSVDAKEARKEAFMEFQLETVQSLISLVKDPREKIDKLQFDMLDRAHARIEKLEAQLDAQRDATEKAKDMSLEREAALVMTKNDAQIKQIATMRVIETVSKLITGTNKAGVQLTPDQLEALVIANKDEEFLTAEQVAEAERIITASKSKVSNGKAVVDTVKRAVETTASDQR